MNEQFNFNEQIAPVQADAKSGATPRAKAILSLVMGIFSIHFGMIPGIICAIIGKKSAKEFLAENADSQYSTMAIIGKILSYVGLPLAIAQVCTLYIYAALVYVYGILVIFFAILSSLPIM